MRLGYTKQAKELTTGRKMAEWLGFVSGHALQDVEDAFARFRSGQNEHLKPRKKFKNDRFTLPGEDVEFRRLNKNNGAIRLSKTGEASHERIRPSHGTPKTKRG